MEQFIRFIGLLALVWLFVEGSGPIEFIKKLFNVHNKGTPAKMFQRVIQQLVNCCLCSGFWFGLIYYQDLVLAALVSVCAEAFRTFYKMIPKSF